jgi:hypothetical protein
MKIIEQTRCDECGRYVEGGIMLENPRRSGDIMFLCRECITKARALLYGSAKASFSGNVRCDCEEWIGSADQIFNAQIQYTLVTGIKYTGFKFEYCPWCGNRPTPVGVDAALPPAGEGSERAAAQLNYDR